MLPYTISERLLNLSLLLLLFYFIFWGEEHFLFITLVDLSGMNKESSPMHNNHFDEVKGRAVRLAHAFVDYVGNGCP